MSESRTDPLTGHTVYLAEERALRPNDFARAGDLSHKDEGPRADCPFCPGNEHLNPEPTFQLFDEEGAWLVRAVPNKYPMVDAAAGQGVHEVIIETPRHIDRTGLLSVEELTGVLTVYAERLATLARDGQYPYRLLYKNVGPMAGASLSHLHSQLIALPSIPEAVQRSLCALDRSDGVRPWSERIASERADGVRVVLERDGWIALCPYASRQPFETTLLPVEHEESFEQLVDSPDRIESLAGVLLPLLQAIEPEIGQSGYNLVIQTSPTIAGAAAPAWHWRIEIVPRVGAIAGFELPTGVSINTLAPERAAARLREHLG